MTRPRYFRSPASLRATTTRPITNLPPAMDLAILERLIEDLDAAASTCAIAPDSLAAHLRAVRERDASSAHGFLHVLDTDPRDGLPWLI